MTYKYCQYYCTATSHTAQCQTRGRSNGEHRCATCGTRVPETQWNGYHLCKTHRDAFLAALARRGRILG